MRFLSVVSAIFIAAVGAESDGSEPLSAPDVPHPTSEITVIEPNKAYVVNLKCLGCPLAVKKMNNEVVWHQALQENALRLQFTIDRLDGSEPTLLLNGRRILPLDPMPLTIDAWQVAANMDDTMSLWTGLNPRGVRLPLQYEHTVLRMQESGQFWVQFDVTGLPLGRTDDPRSPYLNAEPVHLDVKGQKLVQILLQQRNQTNEVIIEDIQVVAREDRAQPYRMKCGRLAMVQTVFDPSEWDEYGQFGTWSRLENRIIGELGDLQHSPLIFPLVLFLAFGMFMLRRCSQQKKEQMNAAWDDDDAEIALLSTSYNDAPPAYTDIPVIKIEEYD
ncbi:hypothetical protein GQ44DRAFT_776324 [Phaeosphaeriaceae sp. PMI808]|nr:hypothetical protein GQ44DRAFT_776324 [Phaeosphaeriaceae sp. PMI808]